MKTVCLFSGGMDSATLITYLKAEGHEVKALGINYGQRHSRELENARQVSEALRIEYSTLDLSTLKPFLGGSSQTSDEIEVPEGHYAEENMKLTVVPNRNMIMLSMAAAWAISLKYDAVAFAAHSGDHTIYPDCRPEFAEAMNRCFEVSDWHKIRLLAPFIAYSKGEIAQLGARLGVPFHLTWSCYKGREYHCGKCGTCTERKEAFAVAGIMDETRYEGQPGADA